MFTASTERMKQLEQVLAKEDHLAALSVDDVRGKRD